MKRVILASDGLYRLVRYESSGDARIEHAHDDIHSNWLTAADVDKIRGEPSLMRSQAEAWGMTGAAPAPAQTGTSRAGNATDSATEERKN